MITPTPDGVVIDVRVTPRSSRSGLAGVRDDVLLLRLHAPPAEGAANAEVVDFFAELLRVPRRDVMIVSGGRNRLKRVRVDGVTATFVNTRLKALGSIRT